MSWWRPGVFGSSHSRTSVARDSSSVMPGRRDTVRQTSSTNQDDVKPLLSRLYTDGCHCEEENYLHDGGDHVQDPANRDTETTDTYRPVRSTSIHSFIHLHLSQTTTRTDITERGPFSSLATHCQSSTHFTEQFLTSSSLTVFNSRLKTHLFHTAYCSEQ